MDLKSDAGANHMSSALTGAEKENKKQKRDALKSSDNGNSLCSSYNLPVNWGLSGMYENSEYSNKDYISNTTELLKLHLSLTAVT